MVTIAFIDGKYSSNITPILEQLTFHTDDVQIGKLAVIIETVILDSGKMAFYSL